MPDLEIEPAETGKPADLINPYEDWEERFVELSRLDEGEVIWKPVYVQLLPTTGAVGTAASFENTVAHLRALMARAPDNLRASRFLLVSLASLVDAERRGQSGTRFERIFLFRSADTAYRPLLTADAQKIATVIEVGVGLPENVDVEDDVGELTETPALAETGPSWIDTLVETHSALRVPVGAEVHTALVDDIIGIANERLCRLVDGRPQTRIMAYWQQSARPMRARFGFGGDAVTGLSVGLEWDETAINGLIDRFTANGACNERALYDTLYLPPPGAQRRVGNFRSPEQVRPYAFAGTHGTFVADLAAGLPIENADAERPIFAVQVPQIASAETWGGRLNFFILEGIQRILHWADGFRATDTHPDARRRVPVVINVSYGVYAGPKDGTGFLEAEIARLVDARNVEGVPTVVVLPTGNAYRERIQGVLAAQPGQTSDRVDWRVQPGDQSISFLEMWVDGLSRAVLTLEPPTGDPVSVALTAEDDGALKASWVHTLVRDGGRIEIGRVYIQRQNGAGSAARTRVVVALAPSYNGAHEDIRASAGAWTVSIANRGRSAIRADVMSQRDDTPTNFPRYGRQAYLDHPSVDSVDPATGRRDLPNPPGDGPVTRAGSLSSYVNGPDEHVFVVGGAMDRSDLSEASLVAGAAPTLGRELPDIAAISSETRAHPARLAAGTFSGSVAAFVGTSAAAPQIARQIVDILNERFRGMRPGSPLPQVRKVEILAKLIERSRSTARDFDQLSLHTLAFEQAPGRPARRVRPPEFDAET